MLMAVAFFVYVKRKTSTSDKDRALVDAQQSSQKASIYAVYIGAALLVTSTLVHTAFYYTPAVMGTHGLLVIDMTKQIEVSPLNQAKGCPTFSDLNVICRLWLQSSL